MISGVKVMDQCLGELPFVPLTAYDNRMTHSLFYRHSAHLSGSTRKLGFDSVV